MRTNLRRKSPGAGRRVNLERRGNRASNRLTRRLATYNTNRILCADISRAIAHVNDASDSRSEHHNRVPAKTTQPTAASWPNRGCDQFTDVDCSWLWIACGQSASVVVASPRTIKTVACAGTWIVCGHDRWRGMDTDADGLRTRTMRGCARSRTSSCPRKDRVCGHKFAPIRDCCGSPSRLIRGRENLPPGRSKACPVLNMMRNGLSLLLLQLNSPGLEQPGDLPNLLRLLLRVHTDLCRELAGDIGGRNLPEGPAGMFVDALAKFLKHLNGGADLDGGGCLHDGCQIRMPGDDLRPHSRRNRDCLFSMGSINFTSSGVTGCAHGLLKPSWVATFSAAVLVGASTTVRSGSRCQTIGFHRWSRARTRLRHRPLDHGASYKAERERDQPRCREQKIRNACEKRENCSIKLKGRGNFMFVTMV